MSKRIVVPLDGSVFAEHALPIAARLARAAGAQLHLVQVHETALGFYANRMATFDARWDETLRTQEAEYLRSAANRCALHEGVVARTELLEGAVPAAISRFAVDLDAALLVMTTHGRGGISRAWVGSVANALVRRAEVPVLLIRPHREQVTWESSTPLHHMLIPLDGSPLSESVIDHALAIGQLTDASFTLLRVVPPVPALGAFDSPLVFVEHGATPAESLAEATRYLENIAEPLRAHGLRVNVDTVVHSTPALAIQDYAATSAIDSIAMATHGRGGWSRVALGSVADRVTRETMLPILLVRGGQHRRITERLRNREEVHA
jgi:nucleotide-binding universal stress UspA family protein